MTNKYSLIAIAMLAACGGDDGKCDVITSSGCDDGKVCAHVAGSDTPKCFAPVEVHGKVIDLGTNAGVANARVVAVDVNGTAVSGVAISGSDGTYKLPVPVERAADGTPMP